MDWLQNLLAPGASSLPSTIILYAFVIAAGVWLGKLKVGGISLGVTFVLFVGLLMGHFGYIVNPDVLHFVREFGLILFIFSIGLQVGPSFFSSFKRGGVVLNGLAALTIALNVVINPARRIPPLCDPRQDTRRRLPALYGSRSLFR